MNKKDLDNFQKELRLRILEMSYRSKTSHIGSCLSSVDIIYVIYQIKKPNDKIILSNGHAAVALYAVLEKMGKLKNPSLAKLHTHPDRNTKNGIDVSTGSLGQGLPIAVGIALADKKRRVFCLVSDGECSEGSIWEALRVAYEQKLSNLTIIVNANGWGAYDPLEPGFLIRRLRGFLGGIKIINGHDLKAIKKSLIEKTKNTPLCIFAKTKSNQFPFLRGQDAHYYVMDKKDYETAKEKLNG